MRAVLHRALDRMIAECDWILNREALGSGGGDGAAGPGDAGAMVLEALAADLAPVRERLERVLRIEDAEILRGKLEELLADVERMKRDVLEDPTAARALEALIAQGIAAGMRGGRPEQSRPRRGDGLLRNGEAAGHPFHGNQYVTLADEGWTGTPKAMHRRADALMRTFQPVEHPVLGTVRFSREGRQKTLYDKRTPHEFLSVKALPELIRRGRIVSSAADRKGRQDVRAFHKLEHGLRIGRSRYRAEVIVKEVSSGQAVHQKFYLHRLHENKQAGSPYSADPAHGPDRGPASREQDTDRPWQVKP